MFPSVGLEFFVKFSATSLFYGASHGGLQKRRMSVYLGSLENESGGHGFCGTDAASQSGANTTGNLPRLEKGVTPAT